MQPETKFKLKVQKELKAMNSVWIVKTQAVALRGIPDILGCINGFFFALELKSKNMRPTKLQEYNLNLIAMAYGLAVVAYPENWELVKQKIKELGEGTLNMIPPGKMR